MTTLKVNVNKCIYITAGSLPYTITYLKFEFCVSELTNKNTNPSDVPEQGNVFSVRVS